MFRRDPMWEMVRRSCKRKISSGVEGLLLSQSSSPWGNLAIQDLTHLIWSFRPRLRTGFWGTGFPGFSVINSAAAKLDDCGVLMMYGYRTRLLCLGSDNKGSIYVMKNPGWVPQLSARGLGNLYGGVQVGSRLSRRILVPERKIVSARVLSCVFEPHLVLLHALLKGLMGSSVDNRSTKVRSYACRWPLQGPLKKSRKPLCHCQLEVTVASVVCPSMGCRTKLVESSNTTSFSSALL
jgi:hypothetical protein